MAKQLKCITVIALLLTAIFTFMSQQSTHSFWLTLAITCGTFLYHLAMRLAVGNLLFDHFMHNRANPDRAWYLLHPWERKAYRRLNVKAWKKHLPTYDTGLFDPSLHTWDEIVRSMCQAELIHETIAVLSFLPLLIVPLFGAWPVFLITSLLAAAADLMFAIQQRFNRDRVLRILNRRHPTN